jgi:hypothetical protein
MRASRRRLLLTFSVGLGGVFLRLQGAGAQAPTPTPRSRPVLPGTASDDDTPTNPNLPNPNKTLLEERQKNIKKEVERLYQLASELKTQVEKTDATTTLSLIMLKKAEEIEKLAKQIKDNAKG